MQDDSIAPSRRDFLAGAGATLGATVAGAPVGARAVAAAPPTLEFPGFARFGDSFRAYVVADPQVETGTTNDPLFRTSQERLSDIVHEINGFRKRQAFTLFLGDMVHRPQPAPIVNFTQRTIILRGTKILVHGNHDGRDPWPEFREMQLNANGRDSVSFSFDCGAWRFVTIPCNFSCEGFPDDPESPASRVLTWLEGELVSAGGRPVMAFVHYHLMPQGICQLDWYTYPKPFRKALVETLVRHGNVRYVLAGHVHNGIQTSVKTAWTHRGTRFLVVPSCTAPRNFGEDFLEFAEGVPDEGRTGGGYYLRMDFEGPEVVLRGRLVGQKAEFVYPSEFREFTGAEDPLWFGSALDAPPGPPSGATVEPSFTEDFASGLASWRRPWRYPADENPGFVIETSEGAWAQGRAKRGGVRLFVREKGRHWAHDEMTELFRVAAVRRGANPLVRARIVPEAGGAGGGGFLRLLGFSRGELRSIVLAHWGDGDRARSRRFCENTIYLGTGLPGRPGSFVQWGLERKAVFLPLDAPAGEPVELSVCLPALWREATGSLDEWDRQEIDRLLISPGVWCLEDPGSRCGAIFERIELVADAPADARGWVIRTEAFEEAREATTAMFETDFGRAYAEAGAPAGAPTDVSEGEEGGEGASEGGEEGVIVILEPPGDPGGGPVQGGPLVDEVGRVD